MTTTALQLTAVPQEHLCPESECVEAMFITDHEGCPGCPSNIKIKSSANRAHAQWHESLEICPCNTDAKLAATTDHRGNVCHQCHHAGCGWIVTAQFGRHLARCHALPIERDPIDATAGDGWPASDALPATEEPVTTEVLPAGAAMHLQDDQPSN